MWPMMITRPRPRRAACTIVDPKRPAGWAGSTCADFGQEPGDEPADLVDALGRVMPQSMLTSRARSAR
jgi:hypothetical protein